MKATTLKKQANLIDRKEIAANGVTLYEFQSDSKPDYHYFVTADRKGQIDPATHEDCKGFHYNGHCCHTETINAMEAQAQAERRAMYSAMFDPNGLDLIA